MSTPDGAYIVWVDGMPRPAYKEPFTKQNAAQMHVAALSLPYRPLRANGPCSPSCNSINSTECPTHGVYKDGEQDYEGYTRAEVMYMRQADNASWGDHDAMRNAEDRWLGKPRQETITTSIQMSFQEWLDALPPPDSVPAQITVVTASTPSSSPSPSLIEGL